MTKPALCLLILLITLQLAAQAPGAILQLNRLADQAWETSGDKSLQYEMQALFKAKELKNDQEIARANSRVARRLFLLKRYQEASSFYRKALEVYERLFDIENTAIIHFNLGNAYERLQKYEKSIEHYQNALTIYKKLPNSLGMIATLKNLGAVYTRTGNFDQALAYYFQALEESQAIENEQEVIQSLNNIGVAYQKLNQPDKAMKYYQEVLELNRKEGCKDEIALTLNNIGTVFRLQGEYDKALDYFQQALNIGREIDQGELITKSLHNIGNVYNSQQQYDKAIEYYRKSLELKEKDGDQHGIASSRINIGYLYYKQELYDKAIEQLEMGIGIADRIVAYDLMQSGLEILSDLYSKTGDYEKSIEYHKRLADIRDSISTTDAHRQVAEMETRYETAKKERKILELQEVMGEQTQELERTKEESRQKELQIRDLREEQLRQKIVLMQTTHENEINQQQIQILEQKSKIQELDLKRQDIIRYSLIVGIFLVLLLAMVTFMSLRRKMKDNRTIREEKAKTEKLLLNILPVRVADDLRQRGRTEPESYQNVTVYFSDIVGFTQKSSELEPKKLISELNDLFTAFDDIMSMNDCERIKTIGDAYLAVCGMPAPNPRHAVNILNAALQIIEHLTERNRNSSINWQIRIGIHTGKVVGGIVGTRKYIYDIFGDTINTASRMENLSEPMQINISEHAFAILYGDPELNETVEFVERESYEVKGKGSMRMFFARNKE